MATTSTFQYRDHQILQTVQISKSPRFDNTVHYAISRRGEVVHCPRTMLEAVRWIDRAARAA